MSSCSRVVKLVAAIWLIILAWVWCMISQDEPTMVFESCMAIRCFAVRMWWVEVDGKMDQGGEEMNMSGDEVVCR